MKVAFSQVVTLFGVLNLTTLDGAGEEAVAALVLEVAVEFEPEATLEEAEDEADGARAPAVVTLES